MGINRDGEIEAYKKMISAGMTPAGACGLIGNLEAESAGFYANRVEFLCHTRMKEFGVMDAHGKPYTDETYTAAVDSGRIGLSEFQHPLINSAKADVKQKKYQYGYGLAQWTTEGRKKGLYNLAKSEGKSIGDIGMQIEYLLKELRENYSSVMSVLTSTDTVRTASDKVLKQFECPADTSESVQVGRSNRGYEFYKNYVLAGKIKGDTKVSEIDKIYAVAKAEVGYLEKASNAYLDDKTKNAGYNNYTKYWRDVCKLGMLKAYGISAGSGFAGGSDWPYCACGVTWAFIKALGEARAKTLLLHGDAAFINCETMYGKAKAAGRLVSMPQAGVLVFFKHSNGVHYHVEFCYAVSKGIMFTIGWNTSGASSVIANGGGVCAKRYQVSAASADYFLPKYDTTENTKPYSSGTIDTGTSVTYLKLGSSGSAVKDLQTKLIAMGYSCGAAGADGEFGNDTLKAVLSFQKYNGLSADGVVGNITANAVNEAYKALTEKKALDPTESKTLFIGKAKYDGVDVRSWAGREYGNIKAWPKLDKGNAVEVLDYTQEDTNGNEWYFVKISNPSIPTNSKTCFGFVKKSNITR